MRSLTSAIPAACKVHLGRSMKLSLTYFDVDQQAQCLATSETATSESFQDCLCHHLMAAKQHSSLPYCLWLGLNQTWPFGGRCLTLASIVASRSESSAHLLLLSLNCQSLITSGAQGSCTDSSACHEPNSLHPAFEGLACHSSSQVLFRYLEAFCPSSTVAWWPSSFTPHWHCRWSD